MSKLPKHIRDYLKRCGCSIEDGAAHDAHHSASRRNFLINSGMAFVGTNLMFNGLPVSALSPGPLLNYLSQDDSDRILVLIRLNGGNDGLNTVIQRGNTEYYNIRPTLAVQEDGLFPLSDEFGLPNEMSDLEGLWQDGFMKIIHNVGYPQANYSHFRSSDILASASDSDKLEESGWIGRYLQEEFLAYLDALPLYLRHFKSAFKPI